MLKEFYDLMSEIIVRFPDFGLKRKIQYSTESCDFASCILRTLNFVFYIKGKTQIERVREQNNAEDIWAATYEMAMKYGILMVITKHVNKLNVILKLSILCIFHIKVHRLLHQLNAPKHAGVAPLIFDSAFSWLNKRCTLS